MTTTMVQTKSADIAISLRADESYRRAADKLQELTARRDALDHRRGELVAGLSRTVDADHLTARAERLLLDDAAPRAADVDRDRLRQSLADTEDELAVVRRAAELQARVVEQEHARVSRAICARLRPRHRRIVARLEAAVRELSAANDEEEALRDELRDAGVIFSATLRPMNLAAAGTLKDKNSAVSRWLADAREHGLLDEGESR